MTSQINPIDIDGTYPIAGVSNNTQGMRDNFTNTKTNFQYAAQEITDLQNKALLKAALTGTTLDNNLANNVMYNAQIRGFSGVTVAIANTSGTINIDCNAGHYQSIYLAGNISLGFDSNTWPTAGTAGMVRTQITVDQVGRTMALPVAVSNGVTGIQGFSSNVITFANTGTFEFGFLTTTGGSSITMFDLNRPLNYYTNDVIIAANTGSTSNTTGALTVAGGVGVAGNVHVGGQVSTTGNVQSGNIRTAGSISATGNVISGGNVLANAGGAVGYATGAGGTVSQATSKSTGVTLNKLAGEITMQNSALAAATTVAFTLTNSTVATKDLLLLNIVGGAATEATYNLAANCTAGSAVIAVRNITAGSLSEALVLRYAVIRGSIA